MLEKENLLTKRKPAELLEWLFLFMTGVYLLCLCVSVSTYVMPAYSFPGRETFTKVLFLTGIPVLLKADLSGGWNRRIPLLALMAGAYFLAYRTGRELFLLMIPLLTIGAAGSDYHRMIRVYCAAVGSFLLVTVLCSFTGVIPNIVHFRGGHLRSSWGIAYETDFASLLLFFVMMLWLTGEKFPDSLAAVGAAVSLWISLVVAGSRTSALCSALLLLFIGFHAMSQWLGDRAGRFKKAGSAFHYLLEWSFLLLAAVFFAALAIYARGGEPGETLNRLLSERLSQTLEVLRDQGLHPFGCNYSPVGRGGSSIQPKSIYFIDSSYPLLLIRYGWVLFLTVAAFWTWMGRRARLAGDRKLLYVMTVVAVHALSEHHFPDAQYNILLVLPFASIPKKPAADPVTVPAGQRTGRCLPVAGAGLLILAAVSLPLPTVLGRLRTVFGIWGTGTVYGELKAILWIVLLLTAVTGLTAAVLYLIKQLMSGRRVNWKTIACGGACAGILLCLFVGDTRVIRSSEGFVNPFSEEEAKVMERIISAADGKACVEELPELAVKQLPGLARSVWYGDDLARMKNASVIVSLREDRQRFADMGFLFTQISDEKGLYSSDPKVVSAMTEDGFTWTDFDTTKRETDLQQLAELNGLELSEEGSIILEDGERLNHGPYLDLFRGEYAVTFDLRAESAADEGEPVCRIRLTEHGGVNALAETTLDTNTLKPDGSGTIELRFYTTGSRLVQFMVFPENSSAIEVTGIHYQKIGSKRPNYNWSGS